MFIYILYIYKYRITVYNTYLCKEIEFNEKKRNQIIIQNRKFLLTFIQSIFNVRTLTHMTFASTIFVPRK